MLDTKLLGSVTSPPVGTTWTALIPDDEVLYIANTGSELRYLNNEYVVCGGSTNALSADVGTAGVAFSTNAINWTIATRGSSEQPTDVAYGNGTYVLVGSRGRIYTTTDKTTLVARTSGTTSTFWGVIYAENRFLAVGNSGIVRTSTNGIAWSGTTWGITSACLDVTYNPAAGLYVAVGNGGNVRTSTNGTTWTARTSGTTSTVYSVQYVNGLYMYGGLDIVGTSTDAITWTVRTTPLGSSGVRRIEYGAGVYVGVANNSEIITSTDAISWTLTIFPRRANEVFCGVTYQNEKFTAVDAGYNVMESSNGYDWQYNLTTAGYATNMAYANGEFIATKFNGFNYVTSTDGINWTLSTLDVPTSSNSGSLVYGGGTYVFFGAGSTLAIPRVYTSTDKIAWTQRTTSTNGYVTFGAYGAGNFVFVGSGGRSRVSTDGGTTWTTYGITTTAILEALTFGDNIFVCGGYGGTLQTSTNGVTWTARTSGTSSSIKTVSYLNNLYLYGGRGGVLATSTDAITWTARTSGTTDTIYAFTYIEDKYYYVGPADIYSSTDAITWSPTPSGQVYRLYNIAYSPEIKTAVYSVVTLQNSGYSK
jgi:hypothetical protein